MKVLVSMRLGFTLDGGLKRGPGGVSRDQHRCAAVAHPSLAVRALSTTFALVLLMLASAGAAPAEPVVHGIGERAVGWDTYRRLDRLPYLSAGPLHPQDTSFAPPRGRF